MVSLKRAVETAGLLESAVTILILLVFSPVNFPEVLNKSVSAMSYLLLPILALCHRRNFLNVLSRDLLHWVLLGLAFVSILWSVVPDATALNLRSLSRLTLFGIYMAARFTPAGQMNLIAYFCGISVFLSVVLTPILPSYGTHIVNGVLCWRGIFSHKNYLAIVMVLSASVFMVKYFFCTRLVRWKRSLYLIFFILSVLLLLLSRGKSSLSIFMIILVTLPLFKIVRNQYKTKTFLLTAGFFVVLALAVSVFLNLESIVVGILGKDLGGNGRDELWSFLIQRGMERFWLGFGYSGFWSSKYESALVAQNTWIKAEVGRGHAHSGFIDLFLSLGMVGSLLMLVCFLVTLSRVLRQLFLNPIPENFWRLQFLVIMLLSNFSVFATLLASRSFIWAIYMSIMLSCSGARSYSRVAAEEPSSRKTVLQGF